METLRRAGLDEDFIHKKGSVAVGSMADDDGSGSEDSYSYPSLQPSKSESKKYSDDFDDEENQTADEASDVGESDDD